VKVLAIGVLVALAPSTVAGSGLDLSWNTCPAASYTFDLNLPCSTPGGSARLFGAFISDVSIPAVVAMEVTLDVFVDEPTLPDFWNFNTVISTMSCQRELSFGVERPLTGCDGVADLWNPVPPGLEASVAIGYYPNLGGSPNRGRLVGLIFRDVSHPTAVAAGTQTFAFQLDLSTSLASETGGPCTGCSSELAVRFAQARLYTTGTGSPVYFFEGPGIWSDCVVANGGIVGCFTPVQNRTWGSLKALYR
jgi:hypothetical protein